MHEIILILASVIVLLTSYVSWLIELSNILLLSFLLILLLDYFSFSG
jgi:hypothetical protein